MKALLLPITCAWVSFTAAQSPGSFQFVIDPSGADSVVVFADGLVEPDGTALVLGSYENTQQPAFSLCAYDAAGQFQWGRKVEATSAGTQMDPHKLVRMSTGDLMVFGTWASGADHAYFLTRLDSTGLVHWTRTYRQEITGSDYGFSSIVATSDDQLVVSMGLIDRTVAMRLDMGGGMLWANRYVTDLSPTNKNPGFDFTATGDGGVLLTEKAEDDIFLVRLSSDGSVQWARRYPNGGYCHTRAAILLEDGGFLIAGSKDISPFAARLDAAGGMIWQKEYALDEGILEAFDKALELPDGDFLLTPSNGSVGIMGVRVSPLGAPSSAHTIGGDGYTRIIGRHEGLVLFGGRALVDGDNGTQDAMLLMATGEDMVLGCAQESTGVTASDIAIPPPIYGCTVVQEAIVQDMVETSTSVVQFGARPLCATVSGFFERDAARWRVFPSPIPAGGPLRVELDGMRDGVSVEVMSSAGEHMAGARLSEGRSVLPTNGWSPGLYLFRFLDLQGSEMGTQRIIVD